MPQFRWPAHPAHRAQIPWRTPALLHAQAGISADSPPVRPDERADKHEKLDGTCDADRREATPANAHGSGQAAWAHSPASQKRTRTGQEGSEARPVGELGYLLWLRNAIR